jgi:transposase
MEATGVYGFELALALAGTPHVEVMIANPRAVLRFAQATLQRSKTDTVDAHTLREFVRRMPFRAWTPPAAPVLELRAIARRIEGLMTMRTQELNRLHAASYDGTGMASVQDDLELAVQQVEARVAQLRHAARQVIATHAPLARAFAHLCSVKGIAEVSAIQVLAEISILPADMTVRQWVAHAGLDPRHVQSGTSVHKPTRISKTGNHHLRRALYMPALVASRYEPHIHAFYQELVARGKTRLQAIVAVMRKLLHAIYGMLKHDRDFDGTKFRALAA